MRGMETFGTKREDKESGVGTKKGGAFRLPPWVIIHLSGFSLSAF